MESIDLELLAPAKNYEVGRTAIDCGADAVYIGARSFGARAAAGNSTEDIARLVEYAHRFGARVYVTMNTILFEDELEQARSLALDLHAAGVDALIVQDMAYVEMDLPIALHASTQCDIRTPEKAATLARAGFRRLVLPREFSPKQMAESAKATGVPIEVFIHGARCVSYSGDCQIGFAATGRSANRGACPQMCRLPYELVDKDGRRVAPPRHYLSLSDMATPDLGVLVDAGATSFKIEGRLKDGRYVANAVAWYSAQLDELVAKSGGRLRRASFGRSNPGFTPDIDKGFFRRPNGGGVEACLNSPNDTGTPVARVRKAFDSRSRSFRVDDASLLTNGDGLGYFDDRDTFCGFRLNRVAANDCFPAAALSNLKPGTMIYRNADKNFNDSIDSARPQRTMAIDFKLTYAEDSLTLTASDEAGRKATVAVACPNVAAQKPQQAQRRSVLERLGDSHFTLRRIDDEAGNIFVPASLLTSLRRAAIEAISKQPIPTAETPGCCNLSDNEFAGMTLSYHDNVANSLARRFYTDRGAVVAEQAIECSKPAQTAGKQVMCTRYCIRRELGACLKERDAAKLPSPLFLRNESGTYRLNFDCTRCGMTLTKI